MVASDMMNKFRVKPSWLGRVKSCAKFTLSKPRFRGYYMPTVNSQRVGEGGGECWVGERESCVFSAKPSLRNTLSGPSAR